MHVNLRLILEFLKKEFEEVNIEIIGDEIAINLYPTGIGVTPESKQDDIYSKVKNFLKRGK